MQDTASKHILYVDSAGFVNPLRVEVQLSLNSVPVTGATVNVLIKRLSDNNYWNAAWQAAVPAAIAMTEYDNTNFKGLYRYEIGAGNLTKTTFLANISYTSGGATYMESHVYETMSVLDDIEDTIANFPTAAELNLAFQMAIGQIQPSGATLTYLS